MSTGCVAPCGQSLAKRAIAPLVNGRIRLRLLEQRDLPLTLAWRNQDHIRQWFFHSEVITPEQHRAWFAQYRQRDDDFVFVIEEAETLRRPVGQVALYNIDWMARRGEFGRLMIGDPLARRLGLARLATMRLVEAAFETWELREIYLEVMRPNLPALALYEACGFARVPGEDPVVGMRRTRP